MKGMMYCKYLERGGAAGVGGLWAPVPNSESSGPYPPFLPMHCVMTLKVRVKCWVFACNT